MRKIYFSLLSLFLLFCWSTNSTAQVSTYTFVQSSGTFVPITGGTILGTATANTIAGSIDDQNFTIATGSFPFTFTFNGVGYTGCNVNTNGYLTFGATLPATNLYAPISSATAYSAAIAAFGGDINSVFDIASTTGELRWETVGTAPNREVVVQWKHYRPAFTTSTTNAYVFDFQIRLGENGVVRMVYGGNMAYLIGTTAIASTKQIGLRGINNADFNNRTNTTAALFTASTAGTLNTSSQAYNTVTSPPGMPSSGLTYTWLPPAPCVAPPGGGTTNGPAGTVCAGSPFTLTVTGASFGTGLTYQWESSPDNSTWTNVAGATSTTLTTSISANTYFRRKITCSGADAWSTGFLISLSPPIAIPFLENFATYATVFPPACWTSNNTTYIGGFVPSAYGAGTGSARFQFYLAPTGTVLDLTTPTFAAVPASYFLTFDHAYATFTGEVDQLQVLYSTNGGGSYTNLSTYLGGSAGPLNTAGTTTAQLTAPTATQWATKIIALPAGTNKIIFRGLSAFGNNLFLDNIAVVSCLAPTGLGLSAITPTSATVSWTASVSNPSGGYDWEVRTSGAGGSGAVGLTASGSTLAGVTSDVANGLTANTTYNLYVRSKCGGPDNSTWAGPFAFTTPCNPIAIPFTETFTSATFPPTCWTRNNTTQLTRNAVSAYGLGTGSAKFDFFAAASGTNLDLITPPFAPVPANYRLTFDHAYATFTGEVDQLQISYSTDGGVTYNSLINYLGGAGGPLNTAGSTTAVFTPTATQWLDKAVDLPVGTNRLRFRGLSAFGNNLYLDNISIDLTPSCLPVSNVTAVAVSPTTVIISFTPPATTPTIGYIVEYGPVGFTPGTTNTPGAGGTIVLGAGSPITVNGLTANITYDFYVRKICIAGVDFSINKKVTATTLCAATNIPYVQTFESSVVPAPPTCTSVQDLNGNSGSVPNAGGGSWFTYDGGANVQTYVSPTKTIRYLYDAANLARPADDWFYTQGLNLTAGTNYRLKFFIKASDGPTWTERLEVKYGTLAHSSAMSNLLYTNNNIATALASPWDSVVVDFTPATTDVYYIGFHAISLGDQAFLYLDNVSVRLAPLVDVGISGITVPSLNCPTNNVFVQATVTNYNTTSINFATYPVTVTANITGAGTGTLTALVNTGTLASGASMGIYLSPAFNFSTGGIYSITAITATTPASNDPETGNDAFTTSITVNPNPPVPVITPANPSVCAGTPVQLSTQFTASPPPVTLPAVSSGTIAVAVPDNTPAGTIHTLAVNTVPAGATVVGISVTLNMTHTFIGDMIINLKAPNNNVLNLINQRGLGGDNLVGTVFTSATGAASLAAAAPPYTGTFAPDGNAANPPTAYPQTPAAATFSSLMSVGNGNWTLAMRDNAGLDLGTLTSWSITITYQILTPVITWAPTAGLYTNAGATTGYTGGNAFSLYANPAATTTYTITATTVAGCTSSASTSVTVNPMPVVTIGSIPDTVCISDQLIPLPASPVGGSWSGVGVSGMNFVPPSTAVGTYTLTYTYTSQAGCTVTATKKISVKDCPERIILLRDNALLLFPNPNSGLFYIKINSVLYNNLVMKVYASNGTLVKTQQLGGLAWGRVVPIDLTNLSGGVYMVKFYYDGGVRTAEKTFKVIIGTE